MMLYLPAEGGEVQRRNRRNALKNAQVEVDFEITDLHKTAPHQWWGAVLCCAEQEKPGKQNKDTGYDRNRNQLQNHKGQAEHHTIHAMYFRKAVPLPFQKKWDQYAMPQ